MATISDEKLRQDVKDIIKKGDLSTLSAKKIRLQLQEKYNTDLTDRKKELEEIIYEAFKERQNSENNSAESGGSDNEAAKAKNGDSQSDSESDFEEPEDAPKKKKPKKSQELNDEELAKQLQQEENSTGRRTRNQSKPVRRKPKAKSGGGGEGGTVKKRTGYSQPCLLSEKLAAVVGESEMARSDVIKKMWEIVRERDLLDPKNKQFMICDEELFKLFGRRRVRTFGMMKYLANHIFKK